MDSTWTGPEDAAGELQGKNPYLQSFKHTPVIRYLSEKKKKERGGGRGEKEKEKEKEEEEEKKKKRKEEEKKERRSSIPRAKVLWGLR
ncbi:hypothetical protein TREES_T100001937 [Tupaia chinensis]|uniref:Uncharacterized protein n=1 Tax=Tupaia chinensis TaxID=246437 RepID=L9JDT8_TUPCH|nr:hypothetical protein TREES_T100001937 [Tupaia chinensis]